MILNNKTIGMILDRQMMSQDFMKYKNLELEFTEDLFSEFCELLKRYQTLNDQIFTFEMVTYLKQFKLNEEIGRFDNYKVIKRSSNYFGQGIRIEEITDIEDMMI